MKLKLLLLLVILIPVTHCVRSYSLKELTVQEYCKNLLHVLQDLKQGKLNPDIQDIIKKQLIDTHPDLFSIPIIKTLIGHSKQVTAVALSPDGTQALTGSHDGTAHLWDLEYWLNTKENGEPVIALEQVIYKIQNP